MSKQSTALDTTLHTLIKKKNILHFDSQSHVVLLVKINVSGLKNLEFVRLLNCTLLCF